MIVNFEVDDVIKSAPIQLRWILESGKRLSFFNSHHIIGAWLERGNIVVAVI